MNSSGRNPDKIPAQANQYERRKLMKEQVKKLHKSIDINKMVSIEIKELRIIYYCKPAKKKEKILLLREKYPNYNLIVKNPNK